MKLGHTALVRRSLVPAAIAILPLFGRGASAGAQDTQTSLVGRQLDSLAEAYFEEVLALDPSYATSVGDHRFDHLYVASFAQSTRERQRDMDERYGRGLRGISRDALDAQHRLTYDVMRSRLEITGRLQQHPSHLIPLNPMFNFTAGFVQLGSGTGAQPFKTVAHYDTFLSRARGFEQSLDTAIANMRRGMAAGVVQPRILMERVLPQLSTHIVTRAESSLFWGPIARMPESFSAADRARLTAAYRERIEQGLVPAFRRLHDFVRDEYLPRTRATAGISALPNGAAWYEALTRASTTTSLGADEIHRIGLSEVARIHAAMDSVRRQVGFTGTLREFFRHVQTGSRFRYTTREEMLADYRAAQARIDPLTDRLFDVRPKATYEIRPVEPFRERSFAGGSYQPASPDGTRPGIFYLNTYDPPARPRFGMEALLLHEGSPGHHFQITVQRELEQLPRVRRFGLFTAYAEGWGLYAESLGRELGVYTDPYQYFGALASELWRAVRLVLDTGIHAKGWSREQAIRYALENSSNSETSTVSEVERFMAVPGQALAYKIGQMKITELRRRAERELGPKFDVKAFHRAILIDGALPLDVLETKIDQWIAGQR